jgi:hypothetical protein
MRTRVTKPRPEETNLVGDALARRGATGGDFVGPAIYLFVRRHVSKRLVCNRLGNGYLASRSVGGCLPFRRIPRSYGIGSSPLGNAIRFVGGRCSAPECAKGRANTASGRANLQTSSVGPMNVHLPEFAVPTHLRLLFVTLALASVFSAFAQKPTDAVDADVAALADCAHPGTPVDLAICADTSLISLSREARQAERATRKALIDGDFAYDLPMHDGAVKTFKESLESNCPRLEPLCLTAAHSTFIASMIRRTAQLQVLVIERETSRRSEQLKRQAADDVAKAAATAAAAAAAKQREAGRFEALYQSSMQDFEAVTNRRHLTNLVGGLAALVLIGLAFKRFYKTALVGVLAFSAAVAVPSVQSAYQDNRPPEVVAEAARRYDAQTVAFAAATAARKAKVAAEDAAMAEAARAQAGRAEPATSGATAQVDQAIENCQEKVQQVYGTSSVGGFNLDSVQRQAQAIENCRAGGSAPIDAEGNIYAQADQIQSRGGYACNGIGIQMKQALQAQGPSSPVIAQLFGRAQEYGCL